MTFYENEENIRLFNSVNFLNIIRSQVAAQAERFKNIMESEPKGRLRSNLRNMSVQLDALDELSAQLEKEMKNSSMVSSYQKYPLALRNFGFPLLYSLYSF